MEKNMAGSSMLDRRVTLMTDQKIVVTAPLTVMTSLVPQVAVFLGSILSISEASSVMVPTFQSSPLSDLQGDYRNEELQVTGSEKLTCVRLSYSLFRTKKKPD